MHTDMNGKQRLQHQEKAHQRVDKRLVPAEKQDKGNSKRA
jgi:hypothetical protein